MPKNHSTTTLELFCEKKRLQKTPNIREMATLSKSPKLATMQRLYPLQNSQFGSKIEILKNMPKTTLRPR